jgi:hypothetical protein
MPNWRSVAFLRGDLRRRARHPWAVGRRRSIWKFWLAVLTEIKNRGTADVCIVVCDGLPGLSEGVTKGWDRAVVQTYVIHLLPTPFTMPPEGTGIRSPETSTVYTAPIEAAAKERFAEFGATWQQPVVPNHPASNAIATFRPEHPASRTETRLAGSCRLRLSPERS